jgi:hypothetical protein
LETQSRLKYTDPFYKCFQQFQIVMEATMKWGKFLWENAIDWYAAGQTPSRKSIAGSADLKKRLPQIYTVAQQLPYVKTFRMFPYISELLARKMTPGVGTQKERYANG